jgi:hypothetical protein
MSRSDRRGEGRPGGGRGGSGTGGPPRRRRRLADVPFVRALVDPATLLDRIVLAQALGPPPGGRRAQPGGARRLPRAPRRGGAR